MFGKKIEKPIADWPVDKVNAEKDYVKITGQYAPPTFGQNAALYSILFIAPAIPFAGAYGIALLVPIVWFSRWIARKPLDVRIGRDEIRIKGKRYARVPDVIEFGVTDHERAFHDNPGLYSNALEVVMQYGEKRVPIAAMRLKDKQKAAALAYRLQRWSKDFEKIMASYQQQKPVSETIGRSSEDDFGPAPDVR